MKRKPVIIVFCLLFFTIISAQEYKFGIKGGLNYNNIGVLYHLGANTGSGSTVIPAESTNFKAEKELGIQFGAFATIKFKSFFVRPEFNITKLKNNYPLAKKTSYYESSRYDIPVLIGKEIFESTSLYIGPVFNLISEATLEGVEFPILFEEYSTSIAAGILFDFKRFGLDIRYQYDLKKVEQQRIDMVRAKYGTNVAHLLEYNGSQILISAHINLINIGGSDGRERGSRRNNWNSCF
jgi:hypothetical protein